MGSIYDDYDLSDKSHFKTGLLCIFLGIFGAHRIYVGKHISGIVMMGLFALSLVGLFIHPIVWGVLLGADLLVVGNDFFVIYCNNFEDSNGKKVSPYSYAKTKKTSGSIVSYVFIVIAFILAVTALTIENIWVFIAGFVLYMFSICLICYKNKNTVALIVCVILTILNLLFDAFYMIYLI